MTILQEIEKIFESIKAAGGVYTPDQRQTLLSNIMANITESSGSKKL